MTASNYNGGLTAEQFLFNEIRIVAERYLLNHDFDDILLEVVRENLFQYPTEKMISRMARACYRRILALEHEDLVRALVEAPLEAAKQVNLYAIMQYNRLVREFMIDLIGDKFRNLDYAYSRLDANIFFSRLQEQDEKVASWSDQTIQKLKRVLNNCLVETKILDTARSDHLNPILISEILERGIRDKEDLASLAAFNCFS